MKFVLAALLLTSANASCITPSGIGNGSDDLPVAPFLGALQQLPYLFLPIADPALGLLVKNYETPIQFRLAAAVGTANYNTVSAYHPTALDTFGRGDRRFCDFASADEKTVHEQVASAYTFGYLAVQLIPESFDAVSDVMENVLNLPLSKLDGSPDIGTPWGLAKVTVDEMIDFMESDGWNADGSLSSDFNKRRYQDFSFTDADGETYTEYKANPSEFSSFFVRQNQRQCRRFPSPWNWEPLLETDGFGYFTKQEHVTPFAGFTGRLLGLSSDEFEGFSSPEPDYDYCEEADFVLENTRDLNDQKKMEVELYDSKFTSLLPMQINWSIQSGMDLFNFWHADMVLTVAMYNACMLVWRDKVIFNLVRPTTVVHALKQGQTVNTFAGFFAGTDNIPGEDWEPYKRTMPHAEYPSGSSCICTAFAEALESVSGQDETGVPVVQQIPAGSSTNEPGVTPANDLVFEYTKWSEISEICGLSREFGGMHFSQAVKAGNDLCTGLAPKVADKAKKLLEGDSDGALADFNDRDVHVRTKEYSSHPGRGSGFGAWWSW